MWAQTRRLGSLTPSSPPPNLALVKSVGLVCSQDSHNECQYSCCGSWDEWMSNDRPLDTVDRGTGQNRRTAHDVMQGFVLSKWWRLQRETWSILLPQAWWVLAFRFYCYLDCISCHSTFSRLVEESHLDNKPFPYGGPQSDVRGTRCVNFFVIFSAKETAQGHIFFSK